MRRQSKIIWNNPGATPGNPQPAVPHTNRGLPSVVSFFDHLPRGFTEGTYTARMVPGSMFFIPGGTYLTTGMWEGTGSDQINYVSRHRFNPVRSMGVNHLLLEGRTIAIYTGQQRITEWDGKGWARVMRPMFIINGGIYACLSAYDAVPVDT